MKFTNDNAYRFSKPVFYFLLSFFTLGYSQGPIEGTPTPPSVLLPEKTAFSENITYKNDASGNPIKLDLYKPKNGFTKLPVVIYVHGGAWAKGDKVVRSNNYIENFILKLVEKNYAVISIDYTLVSETVHFPLPIQDTKDVVRWVRKNADQYHLIPIT
jgi:acetyl esterase/lipase